MTSPPPGQSAALNVTSPSRRPWRRPWVLALLGGLALLCGLALWVVVDVVVARNALTAAAAEVQVLQEQALAGGDVAGPVATLQTHAERAVEATSGPEWRLAARAPWVGPTFAGVATVAGVVDSLARDALPLIVEARESVDPAALAPADGRVDLQPLVDAAPAVVAVDLAVQEARERVAELDTRAMLGMAAGPVRALAAQLDQVAMTTATASRAVQLLPAMLGADGPRTYAILVQANSEIRSLGGIPGVVVLVTADHGVVQLHESIAGSEVSFPDPILPLTQEELDLYSEILGMYLLDVTMTPDFPRAAELARAMLERKTGVGVDGVLAVDPVLLQSILGVTGPVTVDGGPALDGTTAAPYLLNGVYLAVPDENAQDAYFAEAARAVFQVLMSGSADPQALIDVLAGSARDGRLLVWSAHALEQTLLSGTVLSGDLRGADGESPVVGVFLNSGVASKIDAYLEYEVVVERTSCAAAEAPDLEVTIRLESTVPATFAQLPTYVIGTGEFAPIGTMRTNVVVYAPAGGWIDSVARDGAETGVAPSVHEGLMVGAETIDLEPAESTTLTFSIASGNDQDGPVRLRLTPGPHAVVADIHDFPCHG